MPVDRGIIDAQLQEIGEGERWWETREFRALPHILHADERLRAIATGKLLISRRSGPGPFRRWLFVATDQRLICLKQERVARRQIEFAPAQIIRIDQRTRLRSYQVTIHGPDRRYRLRIPKEDSFRFTGALGALVPARPASPLVGDLEPLQWIPGMTTIASLPGVAGIVSKVSMLSPPERVVRGEVIGTHRVERLEATVERLQDDVAQLQQQVGFLEDLLQKRVEESLLPQTASKD